jgi:cysteine-rich secretory family protein
MEANFQAPNIPLFVGETPSARVARTNGGRLSSLDRIGEVMAQGETEPERVVQGWLDSVYHRAVVLDLQAQFGGYGHHTDGPKSSAVLDLGGRRDLAATSGWFPGSGADGVPTRCACDDYAEASGKSGPFGYPITLLLGADRPAGQPTSARVSEGSDDGPEVQAHLVDAFGSPTLVPSAPLKPATRYTVRFAWNGGPDVRWSFTTGKEPGVRSQERVPPPGS